MGDWKKPEEGNQGDWAVQFHMHPAFCLKGPNTDHKPVHLSLASLSVNGGLTAQSVSLGSQHALHATFPLSIGRRHWRGTISLQLLDPARLPAPQQTRGRSLSPPHITTANPSPTAICSVTLMMGICMETLSRSSLIVTQYP